MIALVAFARPALALVGVTLPTALMFNIPAQSVGKALDEYGRVTGLAVLADSEAALRRASAVHGRLTAAEALERLLSGTGLQAHYLNAKSIVVSEPRTGEKPAAPVTVPDVVSEAPPMAIAVPPDQQRFLAKLQAALGATLCRSALTRPGSYRLGLQLHVDRRGAISTIHLLGSSGDARRDRAIVNVLRSTEVGTGPPPTLSQPVLLVLMPEGPQADAICTDGTAWER